ncbi:MAG: hypothetical protein ACKO1G_20295 [Microcystis aeruginosa]
MHKSRRLCGNDEELPENQERVVYVAMVRPMLRRLSDNQRRRLKKGPIPA